MVARQVHSRLRNQRHQSCNEIQWELSSTHLQFDRTVFLPIDVDYRGTSGHVAGMMFNDPGLGKEPDARPLIEKEQTGIKVNFVANPNDRVTLNVEEQSVENVISKISDNHMIIHTDVNGTQTVSELIAFQAAMKKLRPLLKHQSICLPVILLRRSLQLHLHLNSLMKTQIRIYKYSY